jgi:hypothetical protein
VACRAGASEEGLLSAKDATGGSSGHLVNSFREVLAGRNRHSKAMTLKALSVDNT